MCVCDMIQNEFWIHSSSEWWFWNEIFFTLLHLCCFDVYYKILKLSSSFDNIIYEWICFLCFVLLNWIIIIFKWMGKKQILLADNLNYQWISRNSSVFNSSIFLFVCFFSIKKSSSLNWNWSISSSYQFKCFFYSMVLWWIIKYFIQNVYPSWWIWFFSFTFIPWNRPSSSSSSFWIL